MVSKQSWHLQKLSQSAFMLAPGVADITGWPVADREGHVVGEIEDLLVDSQAGHIRYLAVSLIRAGVASGKCVIIPIGLAERHTVHPAVVVPELNDAHMAQLPFYTGYGMITREYQSSVRQIFEIDNEVNDLHQHFYTHQHFNQSRFYQTDVHDEPATAIYARAEHARCIVARLNHQPKLTNYENNKQHYQQQLPMEISEKAMDVINDLIEINNDRVEGFEKASRELEGQNSNLIAVFDRLAKESRENAAELTAIAQNNGEAPVEGTSTSGALHRAWLDVKAVFTGGDTEAVLNECERGEDAIKEAYLSAISPDNEIDYELQAVLQKQQMGIVAGHDLIKSLRDGADEADDSDEITPDSTATNSIYEQDATVTEPSFDSPGSAYDNQTDVYAPEPESIEQEEEWQDVQTPSTTNSKLMEFFVEELKDLLWAEKELVGTLPDMAEAATSQELKNAFTNHLTETEVHVSRLEQIFGILGLEPDTTKCDAMAGIVDEGDNIISFTEEGTAQRDVGLIFAGQKAEHYEIASYGGMISLAKTLGYYEIAELLVLTIDEEKTADALLTEIAENHVNYEASTEQAD